MMQHVELQFAGETLWLNPLRTLFWPRKRMLVLSDLHLGKSAHLRKHGIAVPTHTLPRDLLRLQKLLQHYKPMSVAVVGDLFHAGFNSETDSFKTWLHPFSDIKWYIVKGNHDKALTDTKSISGFSFSDTMKEDPIVFIHEPQNTDQPTISGHIHPGVKLKVASWQTLTLPCFLVSANQIILPAFSEFTGLDTEFLKNNDHFSPYIITEKEIISF